MENTEFFSKEELKDCRDALSELSGVGLTITHHANDQRGVFFDKAKIWRVIDTIISTMYIDRLSQGKMFLHNRLGDLYKVVKVDEEKKEEPITDLEPPEIEQEGTRRYYDRSV